MDLRITQQYFPKGSAELKISACRCGLKMNIQSAQFYEDIYN